MVSWSDPKDWVEGETLLSDSFNTYLRNNLLYLKYKNVYQTKVGFQAANQTKLSTEGWRRILPADLFIDFI